MFIRQTGSQMRDRLVIRELMSSCLHSCLCLHVYYGNTVVHNGASPPCLLTTGVWSRPLGDSQITWQDATKSTGLGVNTKKLPYKKLAGTKLPAWIYKTRVIHVCAALRSLQKYRRVKETKRCSDIFIDMTFVHAGMLCFMPYKCHGLVGTLKVQISWCLSKSFGPTWICTSGFAGNSSHNLKLLYIYVQYDVLKIMFCFHDSCTLTWFPVPEAAIQPNSTMFNYKNCPSLCWTKAAFIYPKSAQVWSCQSTGQTSRTHLRVSNFSL